MPKIAKQLTDLEAKNISSVGRHAVGGVPGLCKQVGSSTSASWILKVTVGGRHQEIGLGSCCSVSLKEARDRARQLWVEVSQGLDPLQCKRQAKLERRRKQQRAKTFDQVAGLYIDSIAPQWQTVNHVLSGRARFAAYVSWHIGQTNCADIDTPDVMSVLEPIWQTKTETASRIRGRIEKDTRVCKNARLSVR